MSHHVTLFCLLIVVVAGLSGRLGSQEPCAAPPAVAAATKQVNLDSREALAGWTVTGDRSIHVFQFLCGHREALAGWTVTGDVTIDMTVGVDEVAVALG